MTESVWMTGRWQRRSRKKVVELWPKVDSSNLLEISNFHEYQQEFLRLFGFGFDEVDYAQDIDPLNPY